MAENYKVTTNGGLPVCKAGPLHTVMLEARSKLMKDQAVYVRAVERSHQVVTFQGWPETTVETHDWTGDVITNPQWVAKAINIINQ